MSMFGDGFETNGTKYTTCLEKRLGTWADMM